MGRAIEVSFKDLPYKPDFAMISPDDPDAMKKHVRECLELGIAYAYDVSWQLARLSGDEIRAGVLGCKMLAVNDYEMSLIADKTGLTETDPALKDKIVVVTRGEKGATIYADGQRYDIPVAPPKRMADPTGVGDAFRGGLLRGMAAGFGWDVAGRMGTLAATYCLEQTGPQNHAYTRAEFVQRYREHFDDDGVLDQLL
jgi:adenosine kinase